LKAWFAYPRFTGEPGKPYVAPDQFCWQMRERQTVLTDGAQAVNARRKRGAQTGDNFARRPDFASLISLSFPARA
jgi:hypothetical protein